MNFARKHHAEAPQRTEAFRAGEGVKASRIQGKDLLQPIEQGMHAMTIRCKRIPAIILLFILVAIGAETYGESVTRFSSANGKKTNAAAFSFDSVWFYRDGTRVIPEISKRWLTVVFDVPSGADTIGLEPADASIIKKKANAILISHNRLTEYFHDPDLAEDACFFKMRNGLTLADVNHLITQLRSEKSVEYVHPAIVLNNKTLAFFNVFQMQWKTGVAKAEQEALLKDSHAAFDETANSYTVNVTALPFFKAVNLLAEDIRVLSAEPYLVEIKPSINAHLSLFMNGGTIGDSVPFSLTITFSERVHIDPGSLATLNLRPPNLQKELFDCTFDPYDYAKAVTRSPIVITGKVRFFAPGEFVIPAVTVNYSCPSCTNSAVRTIDTAPVTFRVSSIIPAAQSEKRLIVPADAAQPDYRLAELRQQYQRHLGLAIIGFGGLALCAAWLILQLFRYSAERRRLKERKNHRQLAEQLRLALQEPPATPHWSYLGEIGALLRTYLLAAGDLDEKYRGGSGKLFIDTVRGHLPQECIDPLSAVLEDIDNCISLEIEQYQGMDQLQREMERIVDLTANNSARHR
jgi:hypothetical protein